MRTTIPSPTRLLAIASAGLLLLAGCSGEQVAERLAEQAAGGDVDLDTDDGSLSIESDDGTSLDVGGQELPEQLPEELPLPEGLAVHGSMAQEGADGTMIGFQATYDGTFEDAVAFFDAELEAAGWTVTDHVSSDMNGLRAENWYVEGFGHAGMVAVNQVGETGADDTLTSVAVNLESTDDAGS